MGTTGTIVARTRLVRKNTGTASSDAAGCIHHDPPPVRVLHLPGFRRPRDDGALASAVGAAAHLAHARRAPGLSVRAATPPGPPVRPRGSPGAPHVPDRRPDGGERIHPDQRARA